MKTGDTVFVVHRTGNVIEGVLGSETTAQGFYTRWGPAHSIYFRTAGIQAKEIVYSDENIFSTKEAAKKEIFKRNLRYPRIRGAA